MFFAEGPGAHARGPRPYVNRDCIEDEGPGSKSSVRSTNDRNVAFWTSYGTNGPNKKYVKKWTEPEESEQK